MSEFVYLILKLSCIVGGVVTVAKFTGMPLFAPVKVSQTGFMSQ